MKFFFKTIVSFVGNYHSYSFFSDAKPQKDTLMRKNEFVYINIITKIPKQTCSTIYMYVKWCYLNKLVFMSVYLVNIAYTDMYPRAQLDFYHPAWTISRKLSHHVYWLNHLYVQKLIMCMTCMVSWTSYVILETQKVQSALGDWN